MKFTAIVEKWETYFVATCPEVDITSQWKTMDEALKNLQEAVELYFEELHNQKEKEHIFNKRLFITSIYANA